MVSVDSTHPAFRKVAVREISGALSAPGQAVRPPSINTDAAIGVCWMGYRSSEVAFAHCDVKGNVLVRVACRTLLGSQGNKKDLVQRAKVGYCPCFATVAHVAIGAGRPLKAQSSTF